MHLGGKDPTLLSWGLRGLMEGGGGGGEGGELDRRVADRETSLSLRPPHAAEFSIVVFFWRFFHPTHLDFLSTAVLSSAGPGLTVF